MTHLTIQQLVAQTDGELAGPSLQLVEKHIGECEACWHEMELLAELDALLASVATIDPGDVFFDELAASVEAEISGKKKPAPRAAAPPAATRPEPATPAPAVRPAPPGPPAPTPAIATPPPASAIASPPPASAIATPSPMPAIATPSPTPAIATPPPVTARPVLERRIVDLPRVSAPAPPTTPPSVHEPGSVDLPGVAAPPTPAGPPAGSFVEPRYTAPANLTTESVGGWIPPAPTADDPFADLVLPPRSAAVTPSPVAAPRPPEARTPRPGAAPRPVPKATPAAAAPAPSRAQAPTAPARVETPAAPPDTEAEGRRKVALAPILIGVGAFLAGVLVAVVITVRFLGFGGAGLHPHSSEPPATTSPEPPPEAATEAPSTVPAAAPAAEMSPPAAEPAPVATAGPEPQAPATPPQSPAHPRHHAPATAPAQGQEGAAGSGSTVIPVQVIRTETTASTAPAAPAPPPAAPAPQAEPGILCGTVRDTDGRAVARAQVMMADVGVVVLTDRAGRFCITAPAGERTLSVVALGFSHARRLVSLGKRTPEVSITLNSAAPFPTPR